MSIWSSFPEDVEGWQGSRIVDGYTESSDVIISVAEFAGFRRVDVRLEESGLSDSCEIFRFYLTPDQAEKLRHML